MDAHTVWEEAHMEGELRYPPLHQPAATLEVDPLARVKPSDVGSPSQNLTEFHENSGIEPDGIAKTITDF